MRAIFTGELPQVNAIALDVPDMFTGETISQHMSRCVELELKMLFAISLSVTQVNFEACGATDTCLSNVVSNINGTCGQGSVPRYGVMAQSATDVAAAINFTTAHNLKVVIKNTGHDYKVPCSTLS